MQQETGITKEEKNAKKIEAKRLTGYSLKSLLKSYIDDISMLVIS